MGTMKRQIGILLAGAFLVTPFAVTLWVVWKVGSGIDWLGASILRTIHARIFGQSSPDWLLPGIGILLVLGAIYLIGLMTHMVVFRWFWAGVERLIGRLPGIKTIYLSVRDLMGLFGSKSQGMGRVVEYTPPGSTLSMLGILTNENPLGVNEGPRRVAVYFPLAYMIGGPICLVDPAHLRDVNMAPEVCLKLCATACIGSKSDAPEPAPKPTQPK